MSVSEIINKTDAAKFSKYFVYYVVIFQFIILSFLVYKGMDIIAEQSKVIQHNTDAFNKLSDEIRLKQLQK
jgi:hypothetical protein